MADELSLYEAWVYTTLSSDTTLVAMLGTQPATIGGEGIFSGYAPKAAVFPAILIRYISQIGSGDLYVNGARRVWTRARYQIVAVDERTDYEGLVSAADRIDTLLSIQQAVPVTGGNIMQSIREFPFRRPVYEGANQEFRELGAFWDIIAQAV
jgi:hypothetical protein